MPNTPDPDAIQPLFPPDSASSPQEMAAGLARRAREGHFDELRGAPRTARDSQDDDAAPDESDDQAAGSSTLSPLWAEFFEHLGSDGFDDLDRRARDLSRRIRDNGVTYNVYADAHGPQRPWSLDLFPLILGADDWEHISSGVLQRVRLLDRVMADVYGPQRLLADGGLPAALVHGHPGYLRPLHGLQPAGDTWLHIAAFDLTRGPDGAWWLVSQRTQAPSGLGYLLENRLAIGGLFAPAFEAMQVQRLAGTYQALMDSIRRMSPAGSASHIALLTSGPYNETYFEHAYLARYLGLTLVEGSDLTVRDSRLYLKTVQGLQPVHGLLKRLDDEFLDPLELRSDSTLGVPGLLQVIRAGNVLMANMPGSAFLESPALLGFLPGLSEQLLGETLQLPALPTWWCGERAALQKMLPHLAEGVIKPTYPGTPERPAFEPVQGRQLSQRELDEWTGRITRQGEDHTVQGYMPLAQMPAWRAERDDSPQQQRQASSTRIVPRSCMLRVFAVSDGPQSWRVLPGGLVRMASEHGEITTMQRGGSSADAWVVTRGAVDRTTLLQSAQRPQAPANASARQRMVTSRSAENLFWLGRYTERCENSARLARVTLECLSGEDTPSVPMLAWLGRLAQLNALVLPSVPPATQARRVFERSLIASLAHPKQSTGVGANLRALKSAASALRERLSREHWNVIVRAERDLFEGCARRSEAGDFSAFAALQSLESLSTQLAAMTGAQTDRMTRDSGWLLLSSGRFVERLAFLSQVMSEAFEADVVHDSGGFDALVALFDSTITYRARYQQHRDVEALLELLVWERENPRSLAWVAQTLRSRLKRLCTLADPDGDPCGLTDLLPSPANWQRLPEDGLRPEQPEGESESVADEASAGFMVALRAGLRETLQASFACSDAISARYFTHSEQAGTSLGT